MVRETERGRRRDSREPGAAVKRPKVQERGG